MTRADSAESTIALHPQRTVSAPLAAILAVIAAVAVTYAVFSDTRKQVEQNRSDIRDLQQQQAAYREILIRIDENVKQLKAQQAR